MPKTTYINSYGCRSQAGQLLGVPDGRFRVFEVIGIGRGVGDEGRRTQREVVGQEGADLPVRADEIGAGGLAGAERAQPVDVLGLLPALGTDRSSTAGR
jgi:hypothetical protein